MVKEIENYDNNKERVLNALKEYSHDCPMLDVVDTKFGLIYLWVDCRNATAKKKLLFGEVIDSMDDLEQFLFNELRSAAIDLYCKEEPQINHDSLFYPSNVDIRSRLVILIKKYMPWIENVDSYINSKEQQYGC